MRLADDGVVPARHGSVVSGAALGFDARLALAGLFVEELHQRFVCVVVEVVDFVAFCQQVGHGLWWGFVRDGARDDVGDVAPVLLGGDVEFRVAVESPERGEVHVPAEDADADGEGFGEFLDAVDEFFPFFFVLVRGVVVVQVVEQIDAAVELVEQAAGDAEAFVEEADGADYGGL